MPTYSFQHLEATFAGPEAFTNLGMGVSVPEGGIAIEAIEDKNVMTIGADGHWQHSLVASDLTGVVQEVDVIVNVNR